MKLLSNKGSHGAAHGGGAAWSVARRRRLTVKAVEMTIHMLIAFGGLYICCFLMALLLAACGVG